MTTVAQLWLPILLSAVFVFIVSSVIHMALQIHKNDYKKLPNEDQTLDALRKLGIVQGQYVFPCAGSMQEFKTPEMQKKFAQGPVGTLIVRGQDCTNIGKALGQWFVFCLVIGVFVGYLTGVALPPGAHYMTVFRVAGTVAILGYAFSSVTDSIWKGISWGTTFRFVIDGVIYGLVTAGTFGWLWPHAA